MSLLLPDAGLLFWMMLSFGIVFLVLYKYGFPVITFMLDERKKFIDDSLRNAAEANERLARIEEESEAILKSARDEQARLLREAAQTREQLLDDAHRKAAAEREKMIEEAKAAIRREKDEAIREVQAQVAELSLSIAEKVIRKELSTDKSRQAYTMELVDETLAIKENEQ